MALWKHSSSFGGIYSQVLVASTDKFWWHSTDKIGGYSVCAVWWCQSTTGTRTTPRSTSGGHFMQVWWSCHANLVQQKWVLWMGGFETEAKVCKSSVVFRLQQEAGLQAVVAGLVLPLCQGFSNVQGHDGCQFE